MVNLGTLVNEGILSHVTSNLRCVLKFAQSLCFSFPSLETGPMSLVLVRLFLVCVNTVLAAVLGSVVIWSLTVNTV